MLFTQLTEAEIAAVFAHYDLGSPAATQLLGGLANTNMKVTTDQGNRVLLKICNDKSYQELLPQMKLLKHLKDHSYPTAVPIPNKSGEYIIRLSSENREIPPIVLYEYIDGKSPSSATVPMMSEIGTALGKLHLIPSMPLLSTEYPFGVHALEDIIQSMKGTQYEHHHFIELLQSELPQMKSKVLGPLPSGIIHMDLFLDNTLFDGDRLLAVVDFEEVIHAPYLIDLAMAVVGCCFIGDDLHIPFVKAMMDDYLKYRTLEEEEIRLFSVFIKYALLGLSFWRFRYGRSLHNLSSELS
eukprot:TRINITY_DN2869_c0_g1_i2.p1 TRINITY_DN2869_c0_g1~~TRINITY_DN2869_c0_g1_i2.p1  ORF type:complete len:297 (+),score=69.76 TRINITY_DN2869_c0_g1_i2:51-941(+)